MPVACFIKENCFTGRLGRAICNVYLISAQISQNGITYMYQLRAYCTNKYTDPSELNLKIRDTAWYPMLHFDGKTSSLKRLVEKHLGASAFPDFQVKLIYTISPYICLRNDTIIKCFDHR